MTAPNAPERNVREIAQFLTDQRDEPWPEGTTMQRLHYWRNKAITASVQLMALTPPTRTDADVLDALAGIVAHFGERRDGPGHSHSVAGVWDPDNSPEKAGKACEWCALWTRAVALASKEPTDER